MKVLIFSIIAIMASHLSYAQEASVKKISKKKSMLLLDAGTNAGFEKGMKVCIFNDTDKRVTCGKVTKVKESNAYVKVSKKRIKKIKKGYAVKVRGSSSMSTGSLSSTRKAKRGGGRGLRTNIKVGYSLMFLSPTTNNKIEWDYLNQNNSQVYYGSPLSPKTSFGDSSLGGWGEFEYKINRSFSMSLGLRYNIIDTSPIQSFIEIPRNQARDKEFIQTKISGSSVGIWTDFYFYTTKFSRSIGLRLGGGLDIDLQSLTFKATHGHDEGLLNVLIAEHASSRITLGLRIPIELFWKLSRSIAFGFRVVPMFSFTAIGEDELAAINGPEIGGLTVNAEKWAEDIPLELDHRAAGLAVEIQPISLIYQF